MRGARIKRPGSSKGFEENPNGRSTQPAANYDNDRDKALLIEGDPESTHELLFLASARMVPETPHQRCLQSKEKPGAGRKPK
jgi:hypothetical protein